MSIAGAAGATTFDLSSSAGWSAASGGFQKTVDGITLTVTAGTFDGSSITPGGSSAFPEIFNGYGAGVCTNTSGVSYNYSCHTRDDSHTIDGSGPNELVFLSFSEDVVLDGLRFGYFDRYDDFDLFADMNGDSALDYHVSDIDIPNNGYYGLSTSLISSLSRRRRRRFRRLVQTEESLCDGRA